MTPKKKKEIIDLFKSGDFTIVYHDRGYCRVYKGKHSYEELPKASTGFDDSESFGYCPDIVTLLAEALGGKTDSI
jgi:hypothetical protein